MRLHPITPALASDARIAASDTLREVCGATLSMYPNPAPPLPWVGYLAEVDGRFVGTCAFKTPPQDGAVEIAYFTFPEHEGRGIATQMAAALVGLAEEAGTTRIRAQTLPERNASTRVLEKLGFRHLGTVQHPEDGPVWEWQR